MRAHRAGGGGRKRTRTGVEAVKLVGVIEAKTGILLYQKVYRWADDANPKALGSLALSFFQFSREIDDGSITCVNFEKPAQMGGQHRRQASNHLRWKMRTAVETMQMLCAPDGPFVVLVFHEIPGGLNVDARQDASVRDLLSCLRDAFRRDHLAAVEAMATEIRSVAATPGGPTDEMIMDIQLHFQGFDAKVEAARAACFVRPERRAKESSGSAASLVSAATDNDDSSMVMEAVSEEVKLV
mmetsp:Transcript_15103/g.45506  ORF Transcript_15103/g.45506 Transcript_15103/m.45506 type:complete len:241 (-) Transcript_15103:92-814(-)|eukprot:CAMPEP_0118884176 /NCGR_PEP_ID=MMETSP1163-20130328/23080_1 /TAXON_ID=124430 /ORGANISM="Phaeomonas parva, Strain CCMP2877" /LENGTH=240 /DNA_ID=CAMNT_0006821861 /DNA_START=207 /DNA_END=929 /DNA_ORIENTATION=+